MNIYIDIYVTCKKKKWIGYKPLFSFKVMQLLCGNHYFNKKSGIIKRVDFNTVMCVCKISDCMAGNLYLVFKYLLKILINKISFIAICYKKYTDNS